MGAVPSARPAGPGQDGPHSGGTRRISMPGREARRGPWRSRRGTPRLEAMESRFLLSWGAVGPELGAFVAPRGVRTSALRSRAIRPAIIIDPHTTINHFLGNRLGPGVDRISRQVELLDTTSSN